MTTRRRAWKRVIPLFACVSEIRRVVCATNAIGSLGSQLQKVIKTRRHFRGDGASSKLLRLAMLDIMAGWTRSALEGRKAMNQFATDCGERITSPSEPADSLTGMLMARATSRAGFRSGRTLPGFAVPCLSCPRL